MKHLIILAVILLKNKCCINTLRWLLIVYIISVSACQSNPSVANTSYIMVLSLSSHAHYALSTDINQHVVLWDLNKHMYEIIANHANIYSAYFIKHTDDFIYQSNRNNVVYVMNVNGKVLQKIYPGFATYGEIMLSNLKTYFAVNFKNEIFMIQHAISKKLLIHRCQPSYQPHTCMNFISTGKLFNFDIANNEKYILTSGFDEYYLWRTASTQLCKNVVKNNAQTVAVISPDNKIIISAGVAFLGYLYTISKSDGENFYFRIPLYPAMKKYLHEPSQNEINAVFAIKYIDKKHILVFFYGNPQPFNYAALYKVNLHYLPNQTHDYFSYAMTPINYLPLVSSSANVPITNSFVRDQAIDTSASAHILVMAEATANGIIEYKYHTKTKALKRIWVETIKNVKKQHNFVDY